LASIFYKKFFKSSPSIATMQRYIELNPTVVEAAAELI
jgi:hypothetical protein